MAGAGGRSGKLCMLCGAKASGMRRVKYGVADETGRTRSRDLLVCRRCEGVLEPPKQTRVSARSVRRAHAMRAGGGPSRFDYAKDREARRESLRAADEMRRRSSLGSSRPLPEGQESFAGGGR